MFNKIISSILAAILSAVIIVIVAALWQQVTGGGLVRVLDGVTADDLEELLQGVRITEFRMEVPNDGQTDTVEMILEEDGICFLTHIQGQFAGGGERVWIERPRGRWILNASTLATGGLIVAANCWEFPDLSER